MYTTASIGGATFDVFITVKNSETLTKTYQDTPSFILPIGAKIPVQTLHERYGGGAANTAVSFSRLGCTAHFMGVLADDQWGQSMLQNFTKEGVHIDASTIVQEEVSSFSIVLQASTKDRTIIYTPGSNVHLHDALFDTTILHTADLIFLNHVQQHAQVIENDLCNCILKNNTFLAWNPGGFHIAQGVHATNIQALLAVTSLLQLNKEEACAFTKTSTITDAIDVLQSLKARYVCVTDGVHGTYGLDNQASTTYFCNVQTANALDSTGAGDAFGSACAWALLSGLSLPEALQAGSINAASVVEHIGAQPGLLTDIELRQRLAHNAPSVTLVSNL